MGPTKYLQIILNHTLNKLNIIVFIFSFLLIFIGRYNEGVISATIILFNIIVGAYQEIRAKQKLEKLTLRNSIQYKVKRGDENLNLNQEEIEKGDIISLEYGYQVPVDGVLIDGYIRIDKSFLTGESDLIDTIKDQEVYAGSNIFSGSANMTASGSFEHSKVKDMEKKGKVFGIKNTPIEKKINTLISLILFYIFWFIVLSTVYLAYRKVNFPTIILVNSVISGLIPSTLLAMVTVVYSWSIAKTFLNKENLLPQKLNAYESLANVDVICFDKTGTLTTNQIEYVDSYVNESIMTKSEFDRYSGIFGKYTKNHTRTSEVINEQFSSAYEVELVEDLPFSSDRKYSSITIIDKGREVTITMGAPEIIMPDNQWLLSHIKDYQLQGLRVIASKIKQNGKEALMGYYILREGLRKDILGVFQALEKNGIEYKIISGDNPISVLAVANNIGLKITKDQILSGADIKSMPTKVLIKLLPSIKIFGRMTPEDKERVIELIKETQYVAMVGDGINDLLPIKKANLGIVLQSGASATRLASDLILLNDDYKSLVSCLEYGKISKFILNSLYGIFFTRFIYLSVLYLTLSLILRFLPFTVIHTSLISLLTVGLGVLVLFAVVNKYQLTWPTLNRIEFIVPAAILTITLSLGLVYSLYDGNVGLSKIATSLVVYLVFCALGLNLLSIVPSKSNLNWLNIRYVVLMFLSQFLIFILLIFIINTKTLANIWSLTKLSINDYSRIGIYMLLWVVGFVGIYILDVRIRKVGLWISNKFKSLKNENLLNLSKK
jgi:cation-transporting P-type ATPase E